MLEAHLTPSTYDAAGERVVQRQCLIQASGDIFLGWATGTSCGLAGVCRAVILAALPRVSKIPEALPRC